MAFNPNNFRASFGRNEPAKSNLFEVTLLGLPSEEFSSQEYRNLTFRCETTSFPGKQIGTAERKVYGPPKKVAYGTLYDDIELTFLIDDSMKEKNIFNRWHQYIVDNTSSSDVAYYDDYVGEVSIAQFNRDGHKTHVVWLREAYPTTVAPLPVSWQSRNEIHRLQVTFAYRYWEQIY